MKRSRMIILGASGVILAGAYLGRTPKVPPTAEASVFESVTECINSGILTRETCENEFAAARETHETTAPRFTGQSECEQNYGVGQCRPATIAGTSYFIPAMVGFLVASHLINQRRAQALLPPSAAQQTCPPGQTPATQPGCVMRSSSGSGGGGWRSFSTATGHAINRSSAASPAIRVPVDATVRPGPRTSTGPVVARSPSLGSTSTSTVSRGGFGSTGGSISSSSS